jgi:stage V sporulation protein B
MATILVPDLSQTKDKNDYFAMENRITQVLKIAFLLGLSTLVICVSIPDSLGKLFFNRNDLGKFIRFSALSAPFTYTASTTFGILNGLGKQGIILRNSIIVSVEEVILLYILTGIPSINIYGFGISLIITSFTQLAINIYEIRKHCYITIPPSELVIYILLGVLVYFLLNIANNLIPGSVFALKNVFIIFFGFTTFFFSARILNKESQS